MDLGDAAGLSRGKAVAEGSAAGVPVHAVQPDAATNTSACTRKLAVNRQLSRAAALPTANHTETRLRVMASSTVNPTAHSSQKMGSMEPDRNMKTPSFAGLLPLL